MGLEKPMPSRLSCYVSEKYSMYMYILLDLLQLASFGLNVVLISRTEEKLERVASEICKRVGKLHVVYICYYGFQDRHTPMWRLK